MFLNGENLSSGYMGSAKSATPLPGPVRQYQSTKGLRGKMNEEKCAVKNWEGTKSEK